MSYNRIFLIGNAGTDPEMRYTPNGDAVTSFRLAVTRRFGGGDQGGEQREETEWFTVQCWNRQAESVNQYLQKGKKVFVEGRFRSRSFTGNDGAPRTVNEIADARVLFLDRPPAHSNDAEPGTTQAGSESPERPAQSPRRRVGGTAAPGAERKSGGEDVEELPW